jgi:hypothetical protein
LLFFLVLARVIKLSAGRQIYLMVAARTYLTDFPEAVFAGEIESKRDSSAKIAPSRAGVNPSIFTKPALYGPRPLE